MIVGISFFLLLLSSIPISSIDPIGSIEIGLQFENPDSKLLSGAKCDTFNWFVNCDIFFEICMTGKSSTRQCNIYSERTVPDRNTESHGAKIRADYELNEEITLQINVMDHDRFSTPDLMAKYTYVFEPSIIDYSHEVARTKLMGQAHPTMLMYLTVKRTCKQKHYGKHCRYCSLPRTKGYCDADGIMHCHSGNFGPDCSQVNFCKYSNCAPFAECKNMDGLSSCICDGTSGARCELGFDSCKEHVCLHNGTCLAVGRNKNFAECVNCGAGWAGLYCEEKIDICVLEKRRLGRPPCLNGGHCVSRMNNTVFTCLCEAGWQGTRCDIYFSTASAVAAICLLLMLVGSLVAFFLLFRKLGLKKGRQKEVEMQLAKSDINSELSRANNLYAEMGIQVAGAKTKPHKTADRFPLPIKTYSGQSTKIDNSYSTPSSSGINKADEEDYEMIGIDPNDPTRTYCSPTSTFELVDEAEYEPISVKAYFEDSVIPTYDSHSVNAANDEYGKLIENNAQIEINRPLPTVPKVLKNNEAQYELLV